jgi:hypothetical protein
VTGGNKIQVTAENQDHTTDAKNMIESWVTGGNKIQVPGGNRNWVTGRYKRVYHRHTSYSGRSVGAPQRTYFLYTKNKPLKNPGFWDRHEKQRTDWLLT